MIYDLPVDMLLPFINDQWYNNYLKELFRHENIKHDQIVTRLNPLTPEPENIRLCDIESSHLTRRASVWNLYCKVISYLICSISGHVQDSKALARYHDVSIELQKQAMDIIDES